MVQNGCVDATFDLSENVVFDTTKSPTEYPVLLEALERLQLEQRIRRNSSLMMLSDLVLPPIHKSRAMKSFRCSPCQVYGGYRVCYTQLQISARAITLPKYFLHGFRRVKSYRRKTSKIPSYRQAVDTKMDDNKCNSDDNNQQEELEVVKQQSTTNPKKENRFQTIYWSR